MDIDSEKQKIQLQLDKANYHAAINLAISAMNACWRDADQAGVDEFLRVMQSIVQTMMDEFGSKSL